MIALGILMEEASRDVLGQTGDLVFTEGELVDETTAKKSTKRLSKTKTTTGARGRPSKKRRVDGP